MKSFGRVPNVGWRCIEAAAVLLGPHEREVVLGDLAEANCGAWHGIRDVLGLALRRHLAVWKSWRPWMASLGLALPASLFLMGCSLAVSRALPGVLHGSEAVAVLWQLALLIGWAWVAGFAAGSISRQTLWATVLACWLPCAFCLSTWRGNWMEGLQLLLFLAPAIWGVLLGRKRTRLALRRALLLAASNAGT